MGAAYSRYEPMSTLSKETIETPISSEAAAPQTSVSAQPSPGQIHSDAVSLEVPLKVHGSKVTEVARGITPHTEPFEEQTSSMIVFPHGGVLRMTTPVNAGQMLVLTNLKSRQDAICRVVKVRSYSSSSSYVEVEFTHRQPGYWGVYFESDAAETAANEAKAAVESSTGTSAPKLSSGDTSFIHLGSQEEVQPAASSTSSASLAGGKSARQSAAPPVSKPLTETAAPKVPPSPAASAPITAPALNLTTPVSVPAPDSTASRAHVNQGVNSPADDLSEAASLTVSEPSANAAPATFGARLSSAGSSEDKTEGSKTGILIAACAVALLLVIGSAVLLLRHKSPDVPTAAAVQPAVSQPAAAEPAAPTSAPVTVTPSSNGASTSSARTASAAPVVKPSREMPVVRESQPVSEADPQPAAPASPAAGTKTTMPSVFGTLNAHPVSSRHNVTTAAPNVDAAPPAVGENALLGITSPANGSALPPPSLTPNGPVPVGGRVREPQLITRVLPQYPLLARQAHTQGDVTLQVVVDKAGHVIDAKAISGPAVLREAAAEAVRRWKYEPTSLDGQAISVELLVTVRFQL